MPSVLYCQQCSLLPNALKRGFYSRRFSNRSFYNRSFYNRSSRGHEHLDLEFLIYRPSSIVRRLSSIVCHPSSVVHRLSSVVCRPSSVVRRLSSFVYRPVIRSSPFRDFFLLKNNHH